MDAELESLFGALSAAQETRSAARLSERNAVDLVQLLRARGLLGDAVVHTASGREYLTRARLRADVAAQLRAAGGRLPLVDAAAAAGVDLAHVERAADELVSGAGEGSPDAGGEVSLYNGDLVTEEYYAAVAAEIDELLAESGAASVPDLAVAFDLSADAVRRVVEAHLGGVIRGRLDADAGALYTETHVAALRAQVVGALRAAGRPTAIATLEGALFGGGGSGGGARGGGGSSGGGGGVLFRTIAAEVMAAAAASAPGGGVGGAPGAAGDAGGSKKGGKGKGSRARAQGASAASAAAAVGGTAGSAGSAAVSDLAGVAQGGGSTWVPRVYSVAQREAAEAYYGANGMMEYSRLGALQVADPAAYMAARHPGGVSLGDCYVGAAVLSRLDAGVEEDVRTAGWADARAHLPEGLGDADAAQLVGALAARNADVWAAHAGVYVVTHALAAELREALVEHARQEGLKSAAARGTRAQAGAGAAGAAGSAGGGATPEASGAGAKPHAAGAARDAGSDDDWDARPSGKAGKKGKGKKKGKAGGGGGGGATGGKKQAQGAAARVQAPAGTQVPEALTTAALLARLRSLRPELRLHDAPELAGALVEASVKAAREAYDEGARSAFSAGADGRRRARAALQAEVGSRWSALQHAARGAELFKADEAEAPHFAKHVLRTCGADAVDSLLRLLTLDEAVQSGGQGHAEDGAHSELRAGAGALSPKERAAMAMALAKSLDAATSEHVGAAVAALSASNGSLAALLDALQAASRACGLGLRAMDKKSERQAVHAQKSLLLAALEREDDPAAALATAVQLLYARHRGVLLQAPGKKLGVAIEALRSELGDERTDALLGFHGNVVKLLVARAKDEEAGANEVLAALEASMGELKTVASDSGSASARA